MKITCPACDAPVPGANLNVSTDVAVCAKCDEAFSISGALAGGQGLDDFDLEAPPRGAWYENTFSGWRVGATTRSVAAFFLVPFMCVWSGGSLGGIYGTQIVKGEFDLMLSLFGIPFFLGTLLFGSIAVMSVCGNLVVTVDGDDGRVFAGVGPIGWTRRFDWRGVTSIEETRHRSHDSDSRGMVISLVGQSRLNFGSMLNEARRYYVRQALRKQLAARG